MAIRIQAVRPTISVLVIGLSTSGCASEQPLTVSEDAPEESSQPVQAEYTIPDYWRAMVAPEDSGTRYDAPWWYLTDQDLMKAVAAADGRVSVGFKDPDERGGVDDEGNVLASPESVAAGKDFLRSLGVSFDFEFQLMPAITATISPALVPTIRAHPRVDYIAANLPGERAG